MPGIEQELFVHPERISSQLICPICTMVLENPVMTPSEHLFCEDELIEWLTRSSYCPITKQELDPATIRPAGRIIMNMLSELERYCLNRNEGCPWTGPNYTLASHMNACKHKSKDELLREIDDKESTIKQMEQRLSDYEKKCDDLKRENLKLHNRCEQYMTRIRVYEAFAEGGKKGNIESDNQPFLQSDAKPLPSKTGVGSSGGGSSNSGMGSKMAALSMDSDIDGSPSGGGGGGGVKREESALEKIARLRKLESFKDDS